MNIDKWFLEKPEKLTILKSTLYSNEKNNTINVIWTYTYTLQLEKTDDKYKTDGVMKVETNCHGITLQTCDCKLNRVINLDIYTLDVYTYDEIYKVFESKIVEDSLKISGNNSIDNLEII